MLNSSTVKYFYLIWFNLMDNKSRQTSF